METFVRDLRYAVTALLRMRGVAAVAILTLALGIGATTTMFSVVYATLLRPPPFADPDRLVIGILPEGFAGLSGKAELWIPPPMAARLHYADFLTTRQNFISVVARLKDGVTFQQANAELAAVGPRFVGNGLAPNTVWGAAAVPIVEARVDPTLRQSALVLFAAAACVLLIA